MYGCKSWTINKAEHQIIDAFELWFWRRLWNPLDSKEVKPVNPKGNQPWVFIGRTDAEAPILWPSDAKSQLIGEELDAEKDWRQEEKERERMRWLDGIIHSTDLNLSKLCGSKEQGWLVCCSLWGCKELDMTEQLNNNQHEKRRLSLKISWFSSVSCVSNSAQQVKHL